MYNEVLPWASAICYSGYREGQSPDSGIIPSREEVIEDLKILEGRWRYLRMYDCGPHAQMVLKLIKDEKLDFQVYLGVYLEAEENNPDCPWGGVYPEETLVLNRRKNLAHTRAAIQLCKQYSDIICAVSAGNEATVDWNDHMVSVDRVRFFAGMLKAESGKPVSFCENWVPWTNKLSSLIPDLDFISMHTYPVWEGKSIAESLEYTKQNYVAVQKACPNKQIVISEAGWPSSANGRGFSANTASLSAQKEYCRKLIDWGHQEHITIFLFEAFDEPWKGSADPLEPEKHWGLYYVDRSPKLLASSW